MSVKIPLSRFQLSRRVHMMRFECYIIARINIVLYEYAIQQHAMVYLGGMAIESGMRDMGCPLCGLSGETWGFLCDILNSPLKARGYECRSGSISYHHSRIF